MSRIWVPKCKIVEPKTPFGLPAPLAGRFKLQVRGAGGRVRRETPWTDNLILDNGLDLIGQHGVIGNHVAVGTGTTTPAEGQSELVGLLASTSNDTSTSRTSPSSPPYQMTKTWTFQFAQGAAEGNLAEVGIGQAVDNLFSRALILDGSGDPTTLTVLADEFLDVTYQLIVHVPAADVMGSINISGTPHDFTLRASEVTNSLRWTLGSTAGRAFGGGFENGGSALVTDGAIGSVTQFPAGSVEGATSNSQVGSYTPGSFERDCQAQWGLEDGNFETGIQTAYMQFGGSSGGAMTFQAELDPVIEKDDTQVLTLPFRHLWGRAAESS